MRRRQAGCRDDVVCGVCETTYVATQALLGELRVKADRHRHRHRHRQEKRNEGKGGEVDEFVNKEQRDIDGIDGSW